MTDRPIYLDHHATTPVDPEVLRAMLPWFTERFGNAASRTHAFGQEAERAVEEARATVARLLGGRTREVVFTSGATEANNLAILGIAGAGRAGRPRTGGHLISVATEHKAVLDPIEVLRKRGFELTLLAVPPSGILDPGTVDGALRPDTFLVSIMLANNEIGVLQPVAETARILRRREHPALLHTDAVQAIGKIPVDVDALDVDLLSLSAHKFYGPKGVGALWLRSRPRRVRLAPRVFGGGHERGLRSGTLDVPGVVGLAAAMELAEERRPTESERIRGLRDRLLASIRSGIPDVVLHGDPEARLPGNLNLGFPGVPGEWLVPEFSRLAVSTGSACTSADPSPSHVLAALGVDPELAHASIRIGIGRGNTEAEIDEATRVVVEGVRGLRERYRQSGTG